jgi:hypothetical protein
MISSVFGEVERAAISSTLAKKKPGTCYKVPGFIVERSRTG